MGYEIMTLPNGLRVVYRREQSPVAYCVLTVDAGARDEREEEYGMAHFTEHMLFKGTERRRSTHIINRLETVGGDLNAFTTKEETVVYATIPSEYAERAMELVADIALHSTFPQREMDKEVEVVLDEIDSYNDSPAELIYDDFENLLFRGHALGHLILGEAIRLERFTSDDMHRFVRRQYRPERMVLCVVADAPGKTVMRWAEKYFNYPPAFTEDTPLPRQIPDKHIARQLTVHKDTHQAHVVIGHRAYDLYHPDRMGLHLLNNILGGPGMSSLLNLSLRERRGLVYTVESTYQPFTDTGEWCVYFGCDPDDAARCESLVYKELRRLCDTRLTDLMLHRYKRQLMGQTAISWENRENTAISLGKNVLRYGRMDNMEEVRRHIDALTADDLLRIANEVFGEELTVLKYQPLPTSPKKRK